MSWNNQGGGPGRQPGRGPWGQGPSGPPTGDLEEIIRRVQDALGRLAPGGKGSSGSGGGLSGRTIAFVILAAILVWFAWGTFDTVQPNEVGINLVFGRYTGKTAAGLNTNWPWPIGSVIKVPVWISRSPRSATGATLTSTCQKRARCSPATRISSMSISG